MFLFFDDDNMQQGASLFDSIKHINEYGQEYWIARELFSILGYKQWRNFEKVIEKAVLSCEATENNVSDHFARTSKMVSLGSGAKREIDDYELSRYACYLIAMNGNPSVQEIALAQTYFAVKTRQQELIENFDNLDENARRLAIRQELKKHNTFLADAAHDAGITTAFDYAVFQNKGYMGLYGGLTAKDIHTRKGLKKNQQILDYMGHEELAANLFRATQTEAKMRRENIKGKEAANKTHFEVGSAVRQTIKDLGGTMPEDLPTPKESIQQLEKKLNQRKTSEKLSNI
ncbi:MAG: DNA damage-inducible protein D [Anaerovibrio sp.]|nr:DNA damage-inducible protein D [Anaerovibrio slackiae]